MDIIFFFFLQDDRAVSHIIKTLPSILTPLKNHFNTPPRSAPQTVPMRLSWYGRCQKSEYLIYFSCKLGSFNRLMLKKLLVVLFTLNKHTASLVWGCGFLTRGNHFCPLIKKMFCFFHLQPSSCPSSVGSENHHGHGGQLPAGCWCKS